MRFFALTALFAALAGQALADPAAPAPTTVPAVSPLQERSIISTDATCYRGPCAVADVGFTQGVIAGVTQCCCSGLTVNILGIRKCVGCSTQSGYGLLNPIFGTSCVLCTGVDRRVDSAGVCVCVGLGFFLNANGQCVQGASRARRSERTQLPLAPSDTRCPINLTACDVPSSNLTGKQGYECVDTKEELSSCGACGNDCSTLPHVRDVGCAKGSCRVFSCEAGFRPNAAGNACVRRH